MKVTREDLQNTYSSKTNQELALIDESKLTDLAKEVLQEIKNRRNISQEQVKEAIINHTKEQILIKKQKRERNIYNIKKYLLYAYAIILFASIKASMKHFEEGMFIVPIILSIPLLVYVFFKR